MPKKTTDYRNGLLEDLKDPTEAAHYLNAALRDSEEMFLVALRDVAEARQVSKVAKDAGVSRESVYRMLAPTGNPTYRSLIGILRALDVEFGRVRPRASASPSPSFTPFLQRQSFQKRFLRKREHATRNPGAIGESLGTPRQYESAA